MISKNIFSFLVLFSIVTITLSSKLSAQTKNVVLSIQDDSLKVPIENVIVKSGKKNYQSDAQGLVSINSDKSELEISVQKTSYEKKTFVLKLNGDTTIVINLKVSLTDLNEISVVAEKENNFGIGHLNNIEGTAIYAGKKSDVIVVDDLNANLATNNQRQLFAKVAGLNIFEIDGAGLQMGIGGRGLSPNRMVNFNTRQNGYDIAADALGYPESYYTPPAEAIDRIEIVRGAASLQYGTQFGGLVNFKLKHPAETAKKFNVLSRQTVGSYGFLNSFNSFSGKVNKLSYYTFFQYKHGDGWRPNSNFDQYAAHAALKYRFTDKLNLKIEYTLSNLLAKQPGGLTDNDYTLDADRSIRGRNWMQIKWNQFASDLNWKVNERTNVSWLCFGLYADRNSIGNIGKADKADVLTKKRDLQIDNYRNIGTELRLLHRYKLLNRSSTFLVGTRYYMGNTYRKQGLGTATDLPEFSFKNPSLIETSDFKFPNTNFSAFTENLWNVSSRFTITPGVRFEYISTNSNGYFNEVSLASNGDTVNFKQNFENRTSNRSFVLGGLGLSFKPTKKTELYANFSQNYRAVNFNDLRIVSPNFKVDENLKDETGYTADLGYRSSIKDFLYVDVSAYYLYYKGRMGTITMLTDGSTYRLRTNVSDSRNMGLEGFAELNLLKLFNKDTKYTWSVFANLAYTDAKYINSKQTSLVNKWVEYAPSFIGKGGMSFKTKHFGTTLQYSYTEKQYVDANNTIKATADGASGLIPSYAVVDWSVNYTWKWASIYTGINNLTNTKYYTRRSEGYPGPGILPSDPINFYVTLQVKF